MKKQVEFRFISQSVSAGNALEFMERVNTLLQSGDGWEVISSIPMGIDTGGGYSGSGSVMMAVSLVRYEYE